MMSAAPTRQSILLLALALLAPGCASSPRPAVDRPFTFGQDTFAYANELVWEYGRDSDGRWRGKPRIPEPEYSHRCFVVVKAAKQFFWHAEFDPDALPADDLTYRRLIRQVLSASPRAPARPGQHVRIPGYAHLHEFSTAQAHLLKRESGGAWRSYFQRGHWRMLFPFSRGSQARTAGELLEAVEQHRPAVIHVVCFPSLRINHALLVFAARAGPANVTFEVYDPNTPEQPAELIFDRSSRGFQFPATAYFPGGKVDVYEVYRGLCY